MERKNIRRNSKDQFSLNDYFHEIWFINLNRREDRKKEVTEEFERFGIAAQRFEAIDGKIFNFPQEFKNMRRGAAAIYLSHLKLIQYAKEKKLRNILIFEDDVEFDDHFMEDFQEGLKSLPNNWNMLYLGGNQKKLPIVIQGKFCKLKEVKTTHAYAINGNFFDTVLERLLLYKKTGTLLSIDQILALLHIDGDVHGRDYEIYGFFPSIVWQKQGYSDNGEVPQDALSKGYTIYNSMTRVVIIQEDFVGLRNLVDDSPKNVQHDLNHLIPRIQSQLKGFEINDIHLLTSNDTNAIPNVFGVKIHRFDSGQAGSFRKHIDQIFDVKIRLPIDEQKLILLFGNTWYSDDLIQQIATLGEKNDELNIFWQTRTEVNNSETQRERVVAITCGAGSRELLLKYLENNSDGNFNALIFSPKKLLPNSHLFEVKDLTQRFEDSTDVNNWSVKLSPGKLNTVRNKIIRFTRTFLFRLHKKYIGEDIQRKMLKLQSYFTDMNRILSWILFITLPIRLLQKGEKDRRNILIVSNSFVTIDYLAIVVSLLKSDPNINLFLYRPYDYVWEGSREYYEKIIPITSIRLRMLLTKKWNLIVMADHTIPGAAENIGAPILRLQHGVAGKLDNGKI